MTTELAELKQWAIMAHDPAQVIDTLRANAGPRGVTDRDFEAIRVPSGAGKAWTLSTLDGQRQADEITGVVVGFADVLLRWGAPYGQGDGGPPICKSLDSLKGIGDPGGNCLHCQCAGYGGDCAEHRLLWLIMSDSVLPRVVVLPRMSVAPCRRYFHLLAGKPLHYSAVVTAVRLGTATSKGRRELDGKVSGAGIIYSRAEFRCAQVLTDADQKRFRALAQKVDEMVRGFDVTSDIRDGRDAGNGDGE